MRGDVVLDLAVDDARRRVVQQALGELALAASRRRRRQSRSESRCMTTTFWTPSRRESLKADCSHSPIPAIASARHASSKTLMTFAGGRPSALRFGVELRDHRPLPRRRAGHDESERRRVRAAREIEHDRAAVESKSRRRRPVEHAPQVALAEPLKRKRDRSVSRCAELAARGRELLRHRVRSARTGARPAREGPGRPAAR